MSKDFVFIENGLVKYEDYSRLIDKCEKALKDNRIKDKEIERLKKEKQELEEIINIRECQLEEMQESKTDYTQVNILEMKIEILNNIRNKAIEYIEKNYPVCAGGELLQILKGSDKE